MISKSKQYQSEYTVNCSDILQIVPYSLFTNMITYTIHPSHMASNAYSHYDFANEIPDPDDFNEDASTESEE